MLVGSGLTTPLLIDDDEKVPVPVGPVVDVEFDAGYGTLDVVAEDESAVLVLIMVDEDSDVRTLLCVDEELAGPVGPVTVELEADLYEAVDDVSAPLSVVDTEGLPVPVGPTPLVEFNAVG